MTKREFKFENGQEVEEIVTGFKGVITGSVYYLTGCNQYLITAKAKDPQSEPVLIWYDEGRLKAIKDEVVITSEEVEADQNGCDIQPPSK